jgi:tight adherence protein C
MLTNNVDLLVALAAAASAFLAFLVVAWPYLAKDQLSARMAGVASEREHIRLRERARLNRGSKATALRTEPRRLYQRIVKWFNLARQAEDDELNLRLRMAGYRGRGPVVAFLAARLIAPAAMLVVAALYVFVIMPFDLPLAGRIGIVLAAAGMGYHAPAVYVRNRIGKRQQAIRRAWPDALDLLLICVESGMGIESAFRKVSEEIGLQSVELAEELSLTTAELAYLQDRRKAYENLGARTGLEGVRGVVTSLIQSEKYGTPLGQSLRVLAQENRDMRMSEAEKKAAALPPKLTVPMILFFLPVLFAVIITPAVIQVMELP